MKRLISLLLILCLLLPLAACGETPAAPAEPEQTAAPTESEAAPAEPEPEPEPESEPEPMISYSHDELVAAIAETGMAYFYHNPYVQYDSRSAVPVIGKYALRYTNELTAECAASDMLLYTDCADFVYRVFRDATGYRILGSTAVCNTANLVAIEENDPIMVYKHVGNVNLPDAVNEARKLIQPGDVAVWYKDGVGGHAIIYLGDYYGDGIEHTIESSGSGIYNPQTGEDPYEANGTVRHQNTDKVLFNPNGSFYLGDTTSFAILRPLNAVEAEGSHLTPAGASRIQYRGLECWKELSVEQYADVVAGDTVTVTLTVMNNSKETYKDLTLSDPIPAGMTAEDISGSGTVQDGSVVWTLNVEPGQKIVHHYSVKLAGSKGDLVTFDFGRIADIPTRCVTLQLSGSHLSEAQLAALDKVAAGELPAFLTDGTFHDMDTLNLFCSEVLGIQTDLPKELSAYMDGVTAKGRVMACETKLLKHKDNIDPKFDSTLAMTIQRHFSGQYVFDNTDFSTRIQEYRISHYVPGDMFIGFTGTSSTNSLVLAKDIVIQIYLGNGNVLTVTKDDGAQLGTFDTTIGLNMRMNFLTAFRPTLA